MDDDIDIEEHDVLDNPRIKSMFPDLSMVKIEVPDDEMELVQNTEETPEDYNENQVLNQYEFNFVTDTDNIAGDISEYANTDNNSDETQLHYDTDDYDNGDGGPQIDGNETDNVNQLYDDITAQDGTYIDNTYCQESQSEYIPNKIILGSRPSYKVVCNYDALYEEALGSQAIVYLENWGERLHTSPCYCRICKTLFPTINALDAHKMVSHSFLIAVNNNTARKSTGSTYIIPPTQSINKITSDAGRLCNHCNNVFPDDTALIKHLYELLPMNNFDSDKPSNVARNSKIGAKIPVSESIANNKNDDKNLIKKVGVASKIKSEVPVRKIKFEPNKECVAIAKPRVTSLKIAAVTDKKSVNVENRKPYYKCTICQAILNSKRSATVHRTIEHPTYSKVHIYLKLYKTEVKKKRTLKGKIDRSFIPKSALLQCGKCHIHFLSALSALQHFIVCNKVYMSENCTICHRNIILKDKEGHYLQHDHCNDSLKVYTVTNKTIYERVLCECPKCGVCFEELPFWAHVKSCNNVEYVRCSICDIKIGKTRYRRHEIKHRIRKFTKKDFILIKYFSNKAEAENEISEPIQGNIVTNDRDNANLKKNIYFCPYCYCCQHRQTFRGHLDKMCKQWKKCHKKVCDKCGLMFSHRPYIAHRPLHDGNKFKLSDYEFINIVTAKKIDPPLTPLYACRICKINFIRSNDLTHHSCGDEEFNVCNICSKKFSPKAYSIHKEFHNDVGIMPELILKYNSLCSTWNLMYMCTECDIVCMSYDTAVEHSQKHIVYHTDTSIYCKICNLSIHESYYKAHADLHETNSRLTKDSFKILKYDYKQLFNNDWMDFTDLTEQDINVIISKSIYKNVRKVKMNVSGDTDSIKYYCGNCKTSVDDVETHLNVICKENVKYRCKYCKIKIDDLNDLVTHELRHENTRNEFKIVTFNDNKDRKLNAKLKKYSAKSEKLVRKRENKEIEKKKKFKAYCCRKCNVCLTLKQNMRVHRCLPDNGKKHFCKPCNQYFTYRFRANHEIAHNKFPNLSKKTLSIIYFNDTYNKAEKLDVKDIADTETSNIFKIVKSKGNEDTKLKLKLKKQPKKLAKRTENEINYRVYCCKKCNVCVKLKKNTKAHRCDAKVQRYNCEDCNKSFTYSTKGKHELAHKLFPNLSKKTLAVTYFGNDDEIDETDVPDDISVDTEETSVLYKCECGVHFNSLKSIVTHTKICKLTNTPKEKCIKCDHLFPTNDYSDHLRNHNKEFIIKKVIKTNWYQCSNCEILFLTEHEVSQHHDNCDPKLGVKCNKCDFKYLKNCINSHRCCETETNLYIGTVTKIKQDLKQITVYSCTKCDINYWSNEAYGKHIRNDHSIRRKKVLCAMCGLYFTKMSYESHSSVHADCKEYKIKVVNPLTKQYKVLRGKNKEVHKDKKDCIEINPRATMGNKINDSDRDNSMNITRSRKRKMDSGNYRTQGNDFETVKIGSKKTKETNEDCSLNLSDTAIERESNSTLNTHEEDSNSALNNTAIHKNVNQLYVRYINTLFKCSKCPLHYLHFESLKYHIKRHSNKAVEHFKCPECHLHFTAITLQKHKKLQHEKNKFKLEDFEIRVIKFKNGTYIATGNQSEMIDDSAIGVFNDSYTEDGNQSKVVDDSTKAGVFSDSNTDIEGSIDGSTIHGESQDLIIGVHNNTVEDESIEAPTIDSKGKTVSIDNSKKEIRLFKCGKCNVCFITQNECSQHVVNHVTIDSKYYISCKICNFQFMISSLKLHMEEHHENEFRLEDFIIEEYTGVGKIDVYCAVDRVQSRLISTTTDEGKDEM